MGSVFFLPLLPKSFLVVELLYVFKLAEKFTFFSLMLYILPVKEANKNLEE